MSRLSGERLVLILRGTASGLITMGIVTPFYAFWPGLAWSPSGFLAFAAALIWGSCLIPLAIRLIRYSRALPEPDELNPDEARIAKWLPIVGNVQGPLFLLSVLVLWLIGQWVWILPALGLIVALHFFPMPVIFGRSIDYYLGSFMLCAVLFGSYVLLQAEHSWQVGWGIIGLGSSLTTASYGVYMWFTVRRSLRSFTGQDTKSVGQLLRL